jgi:hypothetical protein
MNLEILTREDLNALKQELLNEIRQLLQPTPEHKEWMKSADVMKMLNCSPGTLQSLRINGTLPFTKIGGTLYYAYQDVLQILNANKRNAA